MNTEVKGQCYFDAADASNETSKKRMAWYQSFSTPPPVSFFGPFSTAC